MHRTQLLLEWWPPAPNERIGQERADELVQHLRQVSGPIVDADEQDLRSRLDPAAEIVRSGTPVSYIARFSFDDLQVRPLCVGTDYQAKANPAPMNSIQLGRDGVLRWRQG